MKYHLITYGCQMNTADSEEMAQPLIDHGFVATADPKTADVILMNTCTVRDQAEHRAQSNLGRLKGWKAEDPNRVLIVAGCAASLWGESIKKRYPYIDLVAPATQIEKFPELVAEVLKNRWNFNKENSESFAEMSLRGGRLSDRRGNPVPLTSEIATLPAVARNDNELFGNEHTAYVTIMRGCNYSCSYCIVPQVRGREVYRLPEEILSEIRAKAAQGFKEVMLLGQTVNSYYAKIEEKTWDFADLLRAVNAVVGIERIRFMSPHPRHMRTRVIEAMHDSEKVCRHIHLPVQSGSTRLLKLMNRLYTREDYIAITQKLRDAMPGIQITTDVIVGYPGETPEDLDETLSLMKEVAFDGLFAFKFSRRPDTVAGSQPDDVPTDVKEARLQQVLSLNKQIQRAHTRPKDVLSA